MADLKPSEKLILERMLSMNNGNVLSFTNNKLRQFIHDIFKINIYDSKYAIIGESKANRVRAFWNIEGNLTVGKLIIELLDSWKTQKILDNKPIDKHENDLFTQCTNIANRLLEKKVSPQYEKEASIDDFLHKEYSNISIKQLNLDSVVTEVLEKRITEIANNIKNGAPLSAIIMCGSVLEGVLLGVASSNMKLFNMCDSSPKNGEGKVRPFNEWTLNNFIETAHNIGFLGLDVKKYSHSLRDFRNYIHPYQQMANRFDPDDDTAKICFQVLKAAISDLSKTRI